MAAENPNGDSDLPPTPFPDSVVYIWFSLLEAAITAMLIVFALGILEGGEIIPDGLPEITTGLVAFVAVFAGLLALRLRK